MRTRQRVADFGEVFTPSWLVEAMLDLVRSESERIDSRFLEPACGSGNFLVPVLNRKLAAVQSRHGRSDFERRHYALFSVMCIYGLELLGDNTAECREALLKVYRVYLGAEVDDVWTRAAANVLKANIVQGDALSLKGPDGAPITFPEWGYLGRGKFQRRDFRYSALTGTSSFGDDDRLGALEQHEIFSPTRSYAPMNVKEIAE